MVRSTSGPIPKFASARVTFGCELRNLRTTSNFYDSSAVLNLKFLNELAASNDRNSKFTALVSLPVPGVVANRTSSGTSPIGAHGGLRHHSATTEEYGT